MAARTEGGAAHRRSIIGAMLIGKNTADPMYYKSKYPRLLGSSYRTGELFLMGKKL